MPPLEDFTDERCITTLPHKLINLYSYIVHKIDIHLQYIINIQDTVNKYISIL